VRYVELSVAVDAREAERAADVLGAVTGAGVAIELPFAQATLEDPAVRRSDLPALLRVYVTGEDDTSALRDETSRAFERAGIAGDATLRLVDEQDWADAWKEHFHVERFGRVVVVPSWRTHAPRPGDVVLTLDPGMAFGTGQHETTRMCLEALSRHVRTGMRVLDAGCGSGILAVAAARLGAADVLATDVDPDCVRIATENAQTNGVAACVRTRAVSPGDDSWSEGERFEVVVANILAGTIIGLAPVFARTLVADGRLIASGIIAAREGEVVRALERAGLRVDTRRALGEWRCIEALRPGPTP
jgi:ribosomal protein L11 methyltransferase